MADWLKIKSEYISTDISMRDLAKKHDVSFSSLSKKATRERWKDDRTETGNKVAEKVKQKIVSVSVAKEVDRLTRILSLNDTLLEKAALAARQLDQKMVTHHKKIKTVEYNDQRAAGKPTKEITTDEEILAVVDAPIDRQGVKLLASALKDLAEIAARPKADEQSIAKVAEMMAKLDGEAAQDGVSKPETDGVQA